MLNHYNLDDYLNHIEQITNSQKVSYYLDDLKINFFICSGPYGKVINSSPFFGSHGGFHRAKNPINLEQKTSIPKLVSWLLQNDTASINIVENPISTAEVEGANSKLVSALKEQVLSASAPMYYNKITRQSCIKHLSNITNETELISSYHQKTRNCVRKFYNSTAEIKTYTKNLHDFNKMLMWLAEEHSRSILAKGGLAKPREYFEELASHYSEERFELKVAFLQNEPIAGLLNFKTGSQVEYWTPVVNERGRGVNAIYGLIHDTLKSQIGKIDGLFNFGGSWTSQTDLHRFKERFGAITRSYYYHCIVKNNELLQQNAYALSLSYPYFFVREY